MNSAFEVMERRAPILGIQRNVAPELVDDRAWVVAHNVVVREGELRKSCGWTQHLDALIGAVNFIGALRYRSGATATVVLTNRHGYRVTGTGKTLLTQDPFTMSSFDRWDGDYLGNRWRFTNKSDGLFIWDGVGFLEKDADCPYRAGAIATFENHIILGNIAGNDTAAGYTGISSDLLTRGLNWDVADQASDAEPFELAEDATVIQRLLRGPQSLLFAYKRGSIHYLVYGGDFGYRRVLAVPGKGLEAARGLFDLGSDHGFVGPDNLYRFNGSADPLPFGDRVWSYWQTLIKRGGLSKVWAVRDLRQAAREVALGYVDTAEAGKALVWNEQYDCFTTRDWPFNAAGLARVLASAEDLTFDELTSPMDDFDAPIEETDALTEYDLLAGDTNGKLWLVDEDELQAAGVDLTMTLQSGASNFETEQVKVCDGVWVDLARHNGTNALEVYVGTQTSPSDEITWWGPYPYAGSNLIEASDFPSGVWLSVKFVKRGGDVRLRGYGPSIQVAGRY